MSDPYIKEGCNYPGSPVYTGRYPSRRSRWDDQEDVWKEERAEARHQKLLAYLRQQYGEFPEQEHLKYLMRWRSENNGQLYPAI